MNLRISSGAWTVLLAFGLGIAAAWVAGCGGNGATSAAGNAQGKAASASKYDEGPRAGESPVDDDLAERGEKLFQEKGCSACHAFGRKMSGPDLAGVTMRRTATWMENQILHPDVMVKEDPIARELMAKHALQMPNQGLTPDDARAVIEYLKERDAEASEGGS